ncbi:MAG: hypothetical protein IIA62_10845 [Nitrospinae bacterium]|nr:hypothetical protein [Nitrospinota bacterium]
MGFALVSDNVTWGDQDLSKLPQPSTIIAWGDQGWSKLAQPSQIIGHFFDPGKPSLTTVSYGGYGEQLSNVKDYPFEKIDDTLSSSHEKILKFLNGYLFKEREDVPAVVTPRIKELIKDIEEDADEEPSSINFDSFKNFIHFLVNKKNVAVPSFVITYQGNIRAMWRKSRKQHLAVEFHPDEMVTYVIFAPSPKKPEKIERSSGSIGQRRLYDLVVTLGADNWICN